jgi:hypothetical protein
MVLDVTKLSLTEFPKSDFLVENLQISCGNRNITVTSNPFTVNMTFYRVEVDLPKPQFGPYFDGELANLFLSPEDTPPFTIRLPPIVDTNLDFSTIIITSDTLGFDAWTNSTSE